MSSIKRISIIGISGTGKSWLARKLSHKLNLPLFHYDTICWKENWTEEKESIVGERILEIIKQKSWILEGFINPEAKRRLSQSDIIVYLDFPGILSCLGGIQRFMKHRKFQRPELANGCTDKLDIDFLLTMFLRKERQEIEKEIVGFEEKIIRLKNRKQVKKFF